MRDTRSADLLGSLPGLERRLRKHLIPYFGGQILAAITTPMIVAFTVRRQEAGASNAEVNRELAIVKRAFSLAMEAGQVFHRPHIPMLQESRPRAGFFEAEQFKAVRDALPAYLRGLVTFGYITGWRIQSEVLTLQWRQIDRDAGTVRLDPGITKSGEGREFFFTDHQELQDAITDQWKAKAAAEAKGTICPYVFQHHGQPIKDFRGAWRAAVKAAGYPQLIPHDLRRTAVRNLVRAGVPEKTAQELTGHKTRSVFDRYHITTETDRRRAVQMLADSTAGTKKGQKARSGKVRAIRRSRLSA